MDSSRALQYQIIEDQQNMWHRKAQQGCAFASYLANPSHDVSSIWKKVFVNDCYTQSDILNIKSVFDESVSDHECQVLSFILPKITGEADLKIFLHSLYRFYEGIAMDFEYQKDKDHTLVRIMLPLENGRSAWALGFIDIEASPLTRKTPLVEIVLPTKSKQFLMQKYDRYSLHKPNIESISRNEDEKSAHLADIHIDGITDDVDKDNKLWDATRKMKLAKLVGKLDARAKGKVSFTVSGNINFSIVESD